MRNTTEVARWLKDAHACLASARWAFSFKDYRVVTQNAQLCIEFSAKAVIAYFGEPLWRHDPSPQLLKVLKEHREIIMKELGVGMEESLSGLAVDAEEAAPWHAWSTYGKEGEDGIWVSAVDFCAKEVAEGLLERAERSLETAQGFLDKVISS